MNQRKTAGLCDEAQHTQAKKTNQTSWKEYTGYSRNSLSSSIRMLESISDKKGNYLPGPMAKLLADCKRALAYNHSDPWEGQGHGRRVLEELIKSKQVKK